MAELLSRWINQDVGLSIPIQSFERDFANGYYFGELLHKLQLLTDADFSRQFVNNSHPNTLTANFAVLAAILKNLGIPFQIQLAKDIMKCQAGAALKLLYSIKMSVQRREQQASALNAPSSKTLQAPIGSPMHTMGRTSSNGTILPPVAGAFERPSSSTFGATNFHPTTTNALPPSLVSPKGHQPQRPLDRVENRRLAENLLKMTHMNHKDKHMAQHLLRYEKQAAEQEEKQQQAALAAEEARQAALRHAQQAAREKLQANQAYTRSWNSSNMQVWRQNMERIEQTKAARAKWNATLAQQAAERTSTHTAEKVHEVRSGIDEFEKNLERIGVGSSSTGGSDDLIAAAAAASPTPEQDLSPMQHIATKLASTLGSPAQLAKQSAEHMARIHEKCMNDALARKERDRRRRKVLVEQSQQAESLESKKADELFMEKLSKQCAEERAIGEEVWRTEQYHSILAQNAAYRAAQESSVREERERQTVARNQAIYDATKREHERELQSELERFDEIRLAQAAEQHEANLIYGQQLVQRLVDVAHKAACFREVSEQALIPPPMWREWMNLFVQGLPLLPERHPTGEEDGAHTDDHNSSTSSARQPASDSPSEMRFDASVPSSLLASLTLGEKAPVTGGSKTPTSASRSIRGSSASATGRNPTSATAALADDQQTLTHAAFYDSLHQNREVAALMSNLRDVNETTASVLDETALEDYLAGRNEWSYDLAAVTPQELIHKPSSTDMSSSQPPVSTSTSTSSLASSVTASAASQTAPGSSSKSSKRSSSSSKDLPTPPTAPVSDRPPPYTSLSFLGPLHPADQLDLSTPLTTPSSSSPAAAASASSSSLDDLTTHQNPLFGALLQRVLDVASGKEVPPDLPEVPKFPLAVVLLGKPFAGKRTQSELLRDKFGLKIIRPEELIQLGMEELDSIEAAAQSEKGSARGSKSDRPGSSRKSKTSNVGRTPYQLVLVKLKKLLVKSEPIPDDVMTALLVEHIRTLPTVVANAKQRQIAEREAALHESGEDGVADDLPLIPGEGGYVLVDYPSTLAQARLLEQALSGFELPKPPTSKSSGAPKLSKMKSGKVPSKIAPGVPPLTHEGPFPSAFDLVLRLDESNEVLLRRAHGRRIDPVTGKEFHLDFAQPTEADLEALNANANSTVTGAKADSRNVKARLTTPPGAVNVNSTLPERFLAYDAAQVELEEWFNKFGTLAIVAPPTREEAHTVTESIEATRETIRSIVRERMEYIDLRRTSEEHARQEHDAHLALAHGELSTVPPHAHALALEARALEQANSSLPSDYDSINAIPTSPPSTNKKLAASTSSSASAAAAAGMELEPLQPPYQYPVFAPEELRSFSESCFYDVSLAQFLVAKWQRCESNYITYAKQIFRTLRTLRSSSLEYFAATRRNFFAFLRRSDGGKQLLLDQFQVAFNAIPQDLRSDLATKEELHMRVDELSEQLWKANVAKHEENEHEFQRIAGTGTATGQNEFVEAQIHSLYFYYALLMQLELDRYFQVVKIAQDFFTSTKGHVLYDERVRDANEKKSAAQLKAEAEFKSGEPSGQVLKGGLGLKLHINLPLTVPTKDAKVKGGAGGSKKKDSMPSSNSSSSTSVSASGASAGASGKKGSKAGSASTGRSRFTTSTESGIEDPFGELIEILRNNFIQADDAVDQIASLELDGLVASTGATTTRSKLKSSASSSTTKGKVPGTPSAGGQVPSSPSVVRSSSAKKRLSSKGTPLGASATSPAIARPTREALLDAQLRALINNENRLLSARIRRLHRNALLEMSQLRFYTENLFLARLDRYLELRIKGESGAIDSLIYHIQHHHIEAEQPIQSYLRLEGENFYIDADVLNLPEPSTLQPAFTPFSDCFEPLYATRLNMAQLVQLTNSLKSLCVSGGGNGLDVKSSDLYSLFLASFHSSTSTSSGYPLPGINNLPVKWTPAPSDASAEEPKGVLNTTSVAAYFRSLIALFAGPATPSTTSSIAPNFPRAYIDFRDFLISVALLDSIQTPSLNQLLSMQQQLTSFDTNHDGRVSWEEFQLMKLWFELGAVGVEESEAHAINAMESRTRTEEPVKRLKEFFFHLFAKEVTPGAFVLAPIDFLLYLCFNDDSVQSSSAPSVSLSSPTSLQPRSGVEKCQFLLSHAPRSTWGDLTQTFLHRYLQPDHRSHPSTTSTADKFQRKDLTKATQQE